MLRRKPSPNRESSTSWEQEQKWKDQEAAAFTKALAARSDGQEEGHKRRWTPWLLIRYSPTDHGARPTVGAFWLSPDIWVESSDAGGNAVAGEQNFVHVRIFNLGTVEAAPVQVDFYWGNPALGLSAANMNLIGSERLKIRPVSVVEVRCSTPWVPVLVNGGHECLMVNCSNYILDPIISPFEPTLDRHVGQRNVTVLQASAGSEFSLQLQINNAWPLRAATQILARTEHVAVAEATRERLNKRTLLAGVLAYGNPEPAPAQPGSDLPPNAADYDKTDPLQLSGMVYGARENPGFVRASPALSAKIAEESITLHPSAPGAHLANLLLERDAHPAVCTSFPGFVLQELTLKPFEQRLLSLHVQVPADARPGEFIVFHLAQVSEGFTAGGYAVVIWITAK
jgi:hypothetical protein